MKESLYDQVVWLLDNAHEYAECRVDAALCFANQAQIDHITEFNAKLAEVRRLLKNEPKNREADK